MVNNNKRPKRNDIDSDSLLLVSLSISLASSPLDWSGSAATTSHHGRRIIDSSTSTSRSILETNKESPTIDGFSIPFVCLYPYISQSQISKRTTKKTSTLAWMELSVHNSTHSTPVCCIISIPPTSIYYSDDISLLIRTFRFDVTHGLFGPEEIGVCHVLKQHEGYRGIKCVQVTQILH